MICALALAFCLQTQVDLKLIWSLGPEIQVDGYSRTLGEFTRYHGSHTFTFLLSKHEDETPNSTPLLVCQFDADDGSVKVLQTVVDLHKGTPQAPDNTDYSLAPNGDLLQTHWDGTTKLVTTIDPMTLQPQLQFKEGMNHYLEPLDEESAEKSTLFPMLIRTKIGGEFSILSDGEKYRLVSGSGEVDLLRGRSWSAEGVLLDKGDLLSKQMPFFDPHLVGNPESGPFAITNGQGATALTAFFAPDHSRLDAPKDLWPYDADSHGFLIAADRFAPRPGPLQCLDPTTGHQKWIRNHVMPGEEAVHWVGDYAVAFGPAAVDRKGNLVRMLEVLDADTGQTVLEKAFPKAYALWDASGLTDVIILRDDQYKYYDYRIVSGARSAG